MYELLWLCFFVILEFSSVLFLGDNNVKGKI